MEGPVKIEALRIARGIIKDTIREQGDKVSHYKSKAITQAARKLLKQMPELMEIAERNCKPLRKAK